MILQNVMVMSVSNEWWRRRWWRPFFRDLEDMMRDFEEEIYRIMREFEELTRMSPEELRKRGLRIEGPYVYGFSITIGPDGRPEIREFGNVRRIRGRPMISEEREPLVDVFETDDEVTVIAELPGVEKDKISVEISDDRRRMIIRASDTNRKYYKEVDLPAEVDPSSAKANYRNGILEVKLKKVSRERRGFEIKID